MTKVFDTRYALETLASILALLSVLGTLHTFVIGKHFVIPTMVLLLVFFFGNLARFGYRDQRWAKHVLFWVFLLMVFHALFALVWAGEARPGEFFGTAFYPLYGGFSLIVGGLCVIYAKRNGLFGDAKVDAGV